MRKTFCDIHQDREAVTTFGITEYRSGYQPIFAAFQGPPTRYRDCCDECAQFMRARYIDDTDTTASDTRVFNVNTAILRGDERQPKGHA